MKRSDSGSRGGAGVQLSALSKWFGPNKKVQALDGVSVSVAARELLVLLGPSGCGKTTLLRCLGGLESPDEGDIRIGDTTVFSSRPRRDVPANKRDIGMVFQNYALWPHMTVLKNVEYPLRVQGRRADLQAGRALETLALVRCEDLKDRIPAQLSGGQQQRIALARGIVARPSLVLFDEPLSNLDAQLRVDLRAELRALHREVGFTGIYVTHDQEEALQLGDRIAVMEHGRVVQIDTPQRLYSRPATPYVARFLGIRNRFSVTAEGDDGLSRALAEQADRFAGIKVPFELFVREQDVSIRPGHDPSSSEICIEGVLTDQLFAGGRSECIVAVGPEIVRAVSKPEQVITPGSPVTLSVRPSDCLFYRDREPVTMVPAADRTAHSPIPQGGTRT